MTYEKIYGQINTALEEKYEIQKYTDNFRFFLYNRLDFLNEHYIKLAIQNILEEDARNVQIKGDMVLVDLVYGEDLYHIELPSGNMWKYGKGANPIMSHMPREIANIMLQIISVKYGAKADKNT